MQQPVPDESEEKEAEEETEEPDEEYIDEDLIDEVGAAKVRPGVCPITRTVTLQMLLAANILQPGEGAMSIEYLGQRFVGDLLPDGKIRSQETDVVFASPSAWAVHCKRIINPIKRSGCGWASIRYRGRKLDAYKNTWFNRKNQENKEILEAENEKTLVNTFHQRKNKDDESGPDKDKCSAPGGASTVTSQTASSAPSVLTCPPPTGSPATQPSALPLVRIPVKHNFLGSRNNLMHDANTLVECTSFSTLSKIQPFLVTVASSALLVIDLHCHLSMREVVGYLGGHWDVNAHNLSISHAFPCRCRPSDKEAALAQEHEISKEMEKMGLILVGWYHSHPTFAAAPSLRDIDAQLDHEMKLKGVSDSSYTPCVGLICSPYPSETTSMESTIITYWVIPPPENKPHDFGKPMLMTHNVVQDAHLTPEVLNEITRTLKYFSGDNQSIKFKDIYKDETSYLEKLQASIQGKFARDQSDGVLWGYISERLCPSDNATEHTPKVTNLPSTSTGLSVPTVPINLPVSSKSSTAAASNGISTTNPNTPKLNPPNPNPNTTNANINSNASYLFGTEMANALLAAGKLPSSTSIMSNLFLSPMSLNLLNAATGKNSPSLSSLSNFNFSNLATLNSLASINLSSKNMGASSKKSSTSSFNFGGYGGAESAALSSLTFGADGVKNIASSLLNSLGTTITTAAPAQASSADNGLSGTDLTLKQASDFDSESDGPSSKVPKLDVNYVEQHEASLGKS